MVHKKPINNPYGDGYSWRRDSLIRKGSRAHVYIARRLKPRSKYSCYPNIMAVKSAEINSSCSLQNESQVFANLRGCLDIIHCYGEEATAGVNGIMAYNLLLEYAEGGTLADRIKNSDGRGLDESEVKMFARSILRALSHIHRMGYVHCDLKPGNIFLVEQEYKDSGEAGVRRFRAKLGDLGSAKRGNSSMKRRRLNPCWCRTPSHLLCSEAVGRFEQEAPCDIWAFGCCVLEMLTGNKLPPRNEKHEEILEETEKNKACLMMPKIPDGISEEAKDFLEGCLARNPMYRWSADMLLRHTFVSNLPEYPDEEDVAEYSCAVESQGSNLLYDEDQIESSAIESQGSNSLYDEDVDEIDSSAIEGQGSNPLYDEDEDEIQSSAIEGQGSNSLSGENVDETDSSAVESQGIR